MILTFGHSQILQVKLIQSMGREPVIYTPRLELHHMSVAEIISLFEAPEDPWIYEGKGFTNPHRELIDSSGPLAWRVPQVKVDPQLNKWFVRWMVLKEKREIIGSASFHGAPDENGMIEIGLGVCPAFQRQGFGFEALAGMWSWVCKQEGVKTLRYTVADSNTASIALVKKFGFIHVGQQMDEIDGPEEIYELSAELFRKFSF
jgi:ribosomal-protein-alanine N-acetyltransferase